MPERGPQPVHAEAWSPREGCRQALVFWLGGAATILAVFVLMFVGIVLMYSGPSTVVVCNRTGAPLRDVELAVSNSAGSRYGNQRTTFLAAGDSLRLVVNGQEESTLDLTATDREGRPVRGTSSVYLDDRTFDRFEVINAHLDVEWLSPGYPKPEIGGAVRLEMAGGDTAWDAVVSLRDSANRLLSPVLRLRRFLPGDAVLLAPRGRYDGFATLEVSGSMNRIRAFSDSSRFRLGPGSDPRRATLRGPGWREVP